MRHFSDQDQMTIPFNSTQHDDFVTLFLSDLTVMKVCRLNKVITSILVPFANEIFACYLANPQTDDLALKRLSAQAVKVINSNNSTIKQAMVKTANFQLAIQVLTSYVRSIDGSDFGTNGNALSLFVSKFANFSENLLTNSPELISSDFYFFSIFAKLTSNTSVFTMFKELLKHGREDFSPIFEYLIEKKFTEYLYDHPTDENIDLLKLCATIRDFRESAKFVNSLLKLENVRKWEIISKTIERSNSFEFLPLIPYAINAADPLSSVSTTNSFQVIFTQTQVAALSFLGEMLGVNSETEKSLELDKLLTVLKSILTLFPSHTIALNEVCSLIERLVVSTSGFCRKKTLDEILPLIINNNIFESFIVKENDEITTIKTIEKTMSKGNISGVPLRAFVAQLISRIKAAAEEDEKLEMDLVENEDFESAEEFVIGVYNPLLEGSYGNSKKQRYITNDFNHEFTESPPLMI